ncbi:hypothetical protein [Nocardia farcinica]|uniref:hypothetical protein n=1 Tax=Nocardia farcinica TaxID=37329 RepID=UPI0018943415|nr:hypothetical protein [Nocardia farcinica]MBF6187975.1 hypothetical protein [Nocardia farcinica]
MAVRTFSAVMILAAALVGCGSDSGDSTAATTQPPSSTAKGDTGIGDVTTFARKSDGQKVGTFRITDVVAAPASCVINPPPGGQVIAIRAEIVNDGTLMLPKPDSYGVTVVDAGGFTQEVESTSLQLQCEPQFPEIAPSQAPGKTAGWAVFEIAQPNPSAIQYAPYVAKEGATLENLEFVEMSPAMAVVKVPQPLPVSEDEAPTTAPAVTTTVVPPTAVAPPAVTAPTSGQACDIDTDTWAKDANGQQLRCAYAGGPTPRWVNSRPFIGIREPGTPCELGEAVAESPAGVPMVCVGTPGDGEWQPGP